MVLAAIEIKATAAPIAVFVTSSTVGLAVIDAAPKADLLAPVAAMKDVDAVAPAGAESRTARARHLRRAILPWWRHAPHDPPANGAGVPPV